MTKCSNMPKRNSPLFCTSTFVMLSPLIQLNESTRVFDIQRIINKLITEYKKETFKKIEGFSKIEVPKNKKGYIDSYFLAKQVLLNSGDDRLIELIILFSDCNSMKDDEKTDRILYGVSSIDGYSDEILKLVHFLNNHVLKSDDFSDDFPDLELFD